mgnify:CR=1 FL=1
MISFPKRVRAQRAAAVVGVDAGKFSHTLVVRPAGRPDSVSKAIRALNEKTRRLAPRALVLAT